MTKTRFSFLLISLLLIFDTKAQHKDSLAVLKAAGNFVTAFNNFNWEEFRGSFTDDASIFYPFWTQAKRISGKQAIEKTWLLIFPDAKIVNLLKESKIPVLFCDSDTYTVAAQIENLTFKIQKTDKDKIREAMRLVKDNVNVDSILENI